MRDKPPSMIESLYDRDVRKHNFYFKGKYWYIFNPKVRMWYQIKNALKFQLGYWSYAPFVFLAFSQPWLVVSFAVFMVLHEFGHYIILKADDDFKNFFIWPTPGCNTYSNGLYQRSSMVYLTGILFSLLSYPLFLALGYSFFFVWVFAIGCGSMDLIQLILYHKVNGHW